MGDATAMEHQTKPKAGRPQKSGLDIKEFNQKVAKAFGQAVRETRIEHGVSQEDLAYIAGIERSHMGKIERGETMPMIGIVVRIANGLQISSTVLMAQMERNLEKSLKS